MNSARLVLENLYLRDYRGYSQLVFSPDRHVNVLVGPNAAGKTNLLEAINYLSTLRSPRTARDADLVRWDAVAFYIKGEFRGDGPSHTLEVGYRSGRRRALRVDGVPVRRIAEFVGTINSVFFSPDDLALIKGSPGIRRSFFDAEIGQVDARYRRDLEAFGRILSQRNDCLKQLSFSRSSTSSANALLEPWDIQLADVSGRLVSRRIDHVNRWMALTRKVHAELVGKKEALAATYRAEYLDDSISLGVNVDEDGLEASQVGSKLLAALEAARKEEIERGYTRVGPHRDDYQFLVSDRIARMYASQGQQRSIALALKIAEVDWMRRETSSAPILLLDDVLSELDVARSNRLSELLDSGSQTLITTTEIDDTIFQRTRPTVWRVEDGRVIPGDGTTAG